MFSRASLQTSAMKNKLVVQTFTHQSSMLNKYVNWFAGQTSYHWTNYVYITAYNIDVSMYIGSFLHLWFMVFTHNIVTKLAFLYAAFLPIVSSALFNLFMRSDLFHSSFVHMTSISILFRRIFYRSNVSCAHTVTIVSSQLPLIYVPTFFNMSICNPSNSVVLLQHVFQ